MRFYTPRAAANALQISETELWRAVRLAGMRYYALTRPNQPDATIFDEDSLKELARLVLQRPFRPRDKDSFKRVRSKR